MFPSRVIVLVLFLSVCNYCWCYNHHPTKLLASKFPPDDDNTARSVLPTRREALLAAAASSPLLFLPTSSTFAAPDVESASTILSDLPPRTYQQSTTRIFFCRHGETENNRLGRVQGARIDPPLNPTGRLQAQAMGDALLPVTPKTAWAHSPLQRAQETARIASSPSRRLHIVKDLQEIDFGDALEGTDIGLYRAKVTATYAAWAAGELDVRMAGGGETGREVLDRAQSAVAALLALQTPNVVAVAHSSYLRVLLSYVGGISLAEAATWKIRNCSIHVVDFDRTTGESKLVRVSEDRHLNSIAIPKAAVG